MASAVWYPRTRKGRSCLGIDRTIGRTCLVSLFYFEATSGLELARLLSLTFVAVSVDVWWNAEGRPATIGKSLTGMDLG